MGGESQSQQDHDSEFFRNSGEGECSFWKIQLRIGTFKFQYRHCENTGLIYVGSYGIFATISHSRLDVLQLFGQAINHRLPHAIPCTTLNRCSCDFRDMNPLRRKTYIFGARVLQLGVPINRGSTHASHHTPFYIEEVQLHGGNLGIFVYRFCFLL